MQNCSTESTGCVKFWVQRARIQEYFRGDDFPAAHRVRLRTTNGLERINRELRRRTRCLHLP